MLIDLATAAAQLGVSRRTLEREAADGRLAIVRIRGRRMVEPAELQRYVAEATCRSGARETGGKSELASAVAALSSVCLREPREPTRGTSKLRSTAGRSKLRLVGSTTR